MYKRQDTDLTDIPTNAISLAVAQKCNLGCTYCYAEGGDFGQESESMPLEKALQSIDYLLDNAEPGERRNIAFMGGEPLLNRSVLRKATEYASQKAPQLGIQLGFSITSNGTLITEDDGDFFEEHGFAVTISLDGLGGTHDKLRPYKSGRSNYETIIKNIQPLLNSQSKSQVSARVTVTPENLNLRETLIGLIDLGFHSVGFSPMISSPTGLCEMQTEHLEEHLRQMIQCGELFYQHAIEGKRFPFSNVKSALKEIHNGSHRPYPCGAGAGYLGVSAKGDLFACHRFVGDEQANFGSVSAGLDTSVQSEWLSKKHVHFQSPCNTCWARYLCGGGCHHEVKNRGRVNCEYIRGWLEYCLKLYARINHQLPAFFDR